MLSVNYIKNKYYNKKNIAVNADIKISLRNALSDEYIKKVIDKIKCETEEIPHVNINLHIS